MTRDSDVKQHLKRGLRGKPQRCEVAGERYFAVLVYRSVQSNVQSCLAKIQTIVSFVIDEHPFYIVSLPCTQSRAHRWMTPVLWQLNNVVLRILKQGSIPHSYVPDTRIARTMRLRFLERLDVFIDNIIENGLCLYVLVVFFSMFFVVSHGSTFATGLTSTL